MIRQRLYLIPICFIALTCDGKVNWNRASSFPFVSGDSFRAIADHIYDETTQNLSPRSVKQGDVIFLKTDALNEFFTKIHPHIRNKYILITHNSDYGAPGAYAQYLNDPTLHAWFGMSPTVINHQKFIPIPIGIANECWSHGDTETFMTFLKNRKVRQPKKYLVGINFNTATNFAERNRAYNYFSKLSYCSNIGSANHAEYLANMALSKFVVSPPGNSLDCHRTWEILLAGSYPILLTSNLDPLFEGLPVLIVQHWEDVHADLLVKKYDEFQRTPFGYDKLFFFYWHKKIQLYKNQIDPL